MKSDLMQPSMSPDEPSRPQEALYVGVVEVELTGLAIMRQRRMLFLERPMGKAVVEALARETERNHIWEYQAMQEETIDVMIVSQPARQPENSDLGEEHAVMAYLSPDDCPGIRFDARPWLRLATPQDICHFRETTSGEHYLSDDLAQGSRESIPEVEAVLAYCEVIGCGFTCTIPIPATESWILHHRPDIGVNNA